MKYLIANWKMNLTVNESVTLAKELVTATQGWATMPKVVLCPAFPALFEVQEVIAGTRLELGAQNAGIADSGAMTGEVGIAQLEDMACKYAILGHSERRLQFNEDDALVHERLQAVLASSLTPVLCVGESIEVREAGQAEEFVRGQLQSAFANQTVPAERLVLIAYEPVWAIGSGQAATVTQIEHMHQVIRDYCEQELKLSAAQVVVLYGGSASTSNAGEFLALENVGGLLVGGASLRPEEFVAIAEVAVKMSAV